MKYYLIAGEASGDLHASRLMLSLKEQDAEAQFRFYGGDQMAAAGGTMVRHYRELAYMGFVPVLLHLPTILKNMRCAKRDIREWKPDVVVLVDYPGFNLSIAKYVKKHALAPVYYYISPKIWAWKEHRIKNIKRDVDELFSILPFEVEFFERKHHYPIHYVGNPTAEEVDAFKSRWDGERDSFYLRHGLAKKKPILALLAGSRKQEIKDNLPAMLQVASEHADRYSIVVAGAPGIDRDYYVPFLGNGGATVVYGETYGLLSEAHAALVTSGTATLETALFDVPQVVCYKMSMPRLMGWLRKMFLKVKYVSLVNLVADREVVPELVADTFSLERLRQELAVLLPADSKERQSMLKGYREVKKHLGSQCAPACAARIMLELLSK